MAGSPSMPDPPASTGGIGFGVGTAGQMNVTPVHCGPFVNESERKAFEQIKSRLISVPGDGEWLLLTNPAFSATHRLQSDEIDVVAIGPPGVKVIEVKHWTAAWVDRNPGLVEQEADRVTNKARKIGTTLRASGEGEGEGNGSGPQAEDNGDCRGVLRHRNNPLRGIAARAHQRPGGSHRASGEGRRIHATEDVRGKGGSAGGAGTKHKSSHRPPSPEQALVVGVVGEMHACRYLRKEFGGRAVRARAWVSETRLCASTTHASPLCGRVAAPSGRPPSPARRSSRPYPH